MKNKASLVLMELLVMVLIFALAAAGCVRCFVWAVQTAEETALQDRAVNLAQNTAEAIQSTGDIDAAMALQRIPEGLALQVEEIPSGMPGLKEAQILITGVGEREILSLHIAWQEVSDE